MKNLCYLICLATLPTLLLTSCGGDDDDSSFNSETTVLETEEGDKYLVTACGDYEYDYDDDGDLEYSDGTLYYYYDGEFLFDVSTSPFLLTTNDVTKYGETNITITVSTNSSGYITKMVFDYDYVSTYDHDAYKETANLSYDGSGQLTKISSSLSGTAVYKDESENWSGTTTYKYTWSNNKITKIEFKETESWDDGDYAHSDIYIFDYDNNAYENTTRQYCPNALAQTAESTAFGFAYIGLFGLGPKYLPAGMEYEYTETDTEDGETDTDEGEGEHYYSYKFNNDGTINYSAWSSNGTKYFYDYFSYDEYTATASSNSVTVDEDETKRARRGLFHKFSRFSKENKVEE